MPAALRPIHRQIKRQTIHRHLPSVLRLIRTASNMAHRQLVAKVDDLRDGEMKSIPFNGDEKSPILLSKIKGKFYATTAKCSHFGAPLNKGILSCSGTVVCPWHGAKFNVCTGDIEDAPGIGNLYSFQVQLEGDDVYVTADPAKIRSSIRQPKLRTAVSSSGHGVVIIGAGAGGANVIEGLRESGYGGKITLIGEKPYPSVDRTKISKALITDYNKILIRKPEFLQGDMSVTLKLGQKADSIDFANQKVRIGSEEVPYDKLVIATGGVARRLPIPGSELAGIHVLRDVEDAAEISKLLPSDENGPKPNVVVVGSSFIGMEVAVATASKAKVTVIGREKTPFAKVLGVEVGAALQRLHERNGTKFYMQSGVEKFESDTKDRNKVGSVTLKSGEKISADVVVLGVGVSLATEIIKASSGKDHIRFQTDGSVEVTENLELVGVKNVYAIGDIATYPDVITGELNRVEHWNVASNMGRCAAFNIATDQSHRFDKIPIFWSAQGQQLRYVSGSSLIKQYDGVYIDGSLDEYKFAAYYTKGDEVVGLATIGKDPLVAQASELFKLKKFPKASEIRSGKNILDVKLE